MKNTSSPKRAMMLAVTSGKGGVGKTSLAINVAVALSRLGYRVAIVDGDLALGNVDVMLGLTPDAHVGHLLSGAKGLEHVLIDGPRGLRVLPAASSVQPLTALTALQRERLHAAIEEASLSFDFIIIDTAPGISGNVLEMLQLAHHVVLVTSLEPAALVGAYALTKVLWRAMPRADIGLLVNNARDGREARLAFREIDRAASRFLGHRLRYLGFVLYDPAVREALLNQTAVVDLLPQTPASRCFRLLATRLATLNSDPGGVRLLPVVGQADGEFEVPQCA
jgi:flagellar biosynthesis protein FlhG